MNLHRVARLSLYAASLVLLHACGGGGGINDGQTPLRAEPGIITLQSGPAGCVPVEGPMIYIFGGVPPYSLRNTVPDQVALSTLNIGHAGEGTKLTFRGGCLQSIPLVVVDKAGSTISVGLNYLPPVN